MCVRPTHALVRVSEAGGPGNRPTQSLPPAFGAAGEERENPAQEDELPELGEDLTEEELEKLREQVLKAA